MNSLIILSLIILKLTTTRISFEEEVIKIFPTTTNADDNTASVNTN